MSPVFNIKLHLTSQVFPLISFQLSSFALPWLATIWFTYKHGLNQAGEFTFALAIISPISMLFSTPSRNFLLTKEGVDLYALQCRTILMFVGLLIVVALGKYFDAIALFCTLYLFKMSELMFDIPISLAIKKNHVRNLWKLNLTKWFIIVLVGIFAFFINNAELIFFLCFLFFIFAVFIQTSYEYNTKNSKQLLTLVKASIPLGISALIFSIYFNIPRYVIGKTEQKELLAIYSISSFIIMGAIVLVNIFVQTKLPKLRAAIENNSRVFKTELLKLILISAAIYGLIQVGHLQFLSDIFWNAHNNVEQEHPSYIELYNQIIYLAWGPIIFSLANYFLMITGQHKTLLITVSVNVVITYFACLFSLQHGNIYTLLWTYNIGCLLQCFLVLLLCKVTKES